MKKALNFCIWKVFVGFCLLSAVYATPPKGAAGHYVLDTKTWPKLPAGSPEPTVFSIDLEADGEYSIGSNGWGTWKLTKAGVDLYEVKRFRGFERAAWGKWNVDNIHKPIRLTWTKTKDLGLYLPGFKKTLIFSRQKPKVKI